MMRRQQVAIEMSFSFISVFGIEHRQPYGIRLQLFVSADNFRRQWLGRVYKLQSTYNEV